GEGNHGCHAPTEAPAQDADRRVCPAGELVGKQDLNNFDTSWPARNGHRRQQNRTSRHRCSGRDSRQFDPAELQRNGKHHVDQPANGVTGTLYPKPKIHKVPTPTAPTAMSHLSRSPAPRRLDACQPHSSKNNGMLEGNVTLTQCDSSATPPGYKR